MDAIIIGAGAAGLAAAELLTHEGLDVMVVEARDRIGGRLFTVHDEATPLPVELGAEFIDVPGAAWDAVRRANGAAYRSIDGMWSVERGRVRQLDVNGIAERVLGRLEEPPERDTTFRTWLALQRGVSEEDAEWMLRYVEGFHAAELDRVGVQWLSHTVEDSAGGGGESRHHAIGGFALAATGLRMGAEYPLRLSTVVERIAWQPGRVRVHCRSISGATTDVFEAPRSIITLPLGVLHAGSVRFEPEPPTLQAARELARASVIKVVMRFDEAFWNDALDFPDGDRERKFFMSGEAFPTWWTTAPVLTPMLTAWAGGDAAGRVRAMGDPVDVALHSLATMLGIRRGRIEEHLRMTWHHDWDADPFAGCAYSYAPVDGMSAMRQFRRPVAGTLFMAGETAAKDGWNGTVDGAIESGRRAARELLRAARQRPAGTRSATTGR